MKFEVSSQRRANPKLKGTLRPTWLRAPSLHVGQSKEKRQR